MQVALSVRRSARLVARERENQSSGGERFSLRRASRASAHQPPLAYAILSAVRVLCRRGAHHTARHARRTVCASPSSSP